MTTREKAGIIDAILLGLPVLPKSAKPPAPDRKPKGEQLSTREAQWHCLFLSLLMARL